LIEALIIGAGPAGLTAATYLARFHRDVLLVDDGASRARYIPLSRNTPGFPSGVDGPSLLESLREQAARFGVRSCSARVDSLRKLAGGFAASAAGETIETANVVVATGIEDILPVMEGVEEAICEGVVRLCSVCDAYETDGHRVAVYGPPADVASHAKYMRSFTTSVTLVCSEDGLSADVRRELDGLGIACVEDACALSWSRADGVRVERRTSAPVFFDAFYPFLGHRPQSTLATGVGARCTDDGTLFVDSHQQTSVEGLFAAGDIVTDLNQISVAYGHAAIAATTIHNRLPHKPRG
jgi:thioredoxin reductase (NADPH)